MTEKASGRKHYQRLSDTRDQQHQDHDALSAALDCAGQGWTVFPCQSQSKRPATRRGFKDATTNPATIRRWWPARPDYNIGVATGATSGAYVIEQHLPPEQFQILKAAEASERELLTALVANMDSDQ
jgi:hypothetical protein